MILKTKKFKIEYTDPKTGELVEDVVEFSDTPAGVCPKTGFEYGAISAEEWAEDAVYSAADKGPHKITLLKEVTK